MKYVVVILIIVVILGAGYYFYKKDQDAKSDPTIPIEGAGSGSTTSSASSISDRKMSNQQINQVASEATRKYNDTPGSERDKIKAIRPQIDQAQSMGFTLTWEGGRFVPYSNSAGSKEKSGGILSGIFGTKESRQAKRAERKQRRNS